MMRKPILWMILWAVYTPLFAQNLNEKIKRDPAVVTGKLKNGLTYFIQKNTEPKKRAELRLVLKAGSLQERDDQQGLAHFMEHMNFNGTRNFPKNELVDFLQKAGVKFGADLNAYTGFDRTVYMLPIPTDSAGLLEKGLLILEDWAQSALLDPVEIDKERGVVLEESRSGKGASKRMSEKSLKLIAGDSRYGKRLPIGKDDIIQNFKPELLKDFHRDWYRPDLMAVIAVGDFDVDQVKRIIETRFAKLTNPAKAPARKEFDVPVKGSAEEIITDPEFPQYVVSLMYKLPADKDKTWNGVHKSNVRGAFNMMISQRLQELTKKADPPFLYGGSGYGGTGLGDLMAYNSTAVAKGPEGIETALRAVAQENARVLKFGFTQSELDRVKKNWLNQLERTLKEKDKRQSAGLVNTLTNDFLEDDSSPSVEDNYAFNTKDVERITLAEVNALAPYYLNNANRIVIVRAPEKDKNKIPSIDALKSLLDKSGQQLTAYQDDVVDKPLLASLPSGGKVATEKYLEKLGVTELTLSNGVRVLLKPTDFKNDQILFKATARGGYSLFPKDRETGMFTSYLMQSGGMGEFSQTQLGKALTGKTANVGAYVSELSEGLSGSTNPKDLETALQLVYGYFTAPRKDAEVVKGVITSEKQFLENSLKTVTPEKVFSDTLGAVLSNYNPLRMPLKPEDLDKVNLERAYEIYKDRFSDASDFVFTFVGSFKAEEIKPILAKYLGALPSTDRDDDYIHPNIFPPAGKIEKTVYKGQEDKSRVSLVLSGDFEYSIENEAQIDALGEVLEIKLTETLREEESGVYGVGVSASTSKYPTGHYRFSIGFGCAPANVDKLINRTMTEIEKLRKNGALQVDIEKFVAESKRKEEVDLKTNGFWLNYLDGSVFNDNDLNTVFRSDELLRTVTVASTKKAAQTYLSGNNLIRVVLMPEKK